MKAIELGGDGTAAVVERDIGDLRPGWVRVGVSAVGICGSDLHLLNGGMIPSKGLRPGHEVAGIVEMVGDGVELATGGKVAVEPLRSCGGCFSCSTGHHNRCPSGRVLGVTAVGGMAEYFDVPATTLHALPADLDDNVAALCEPMAVCVRAVRLGGVGPGDRVAILGAGTIGLLSILVARHAGAGEVFCTARYPRQAELARAMGATQVFDSARDLVREVSDQVVDVVIETVGGAADTLTEAVTVARPGGTIAMLGLFDEPLTLPAMGFLAKELKLFASNCYARDARVGDFALGTELTAHYADLIPELVTHRFSLDQIVEAYATAADKNSGAIKVQVIPGA